MGCDDEPEGFRFIVIAEAQDAGERPDGIEVVEGRYCDACGVLVGLIYADGGLRPVEDRDRMYESAADGARRPAEGGGQ